LSLVSCTNGQPQRRASAIAQVNIQPGAESGGHGTVLLRIPTDNENPSSPDQPRIGIPATISLRQWVGPGYAVRHHRPRYTRHGHLPAQTLELA
jgi:hypothetical protein